MSHLVSYKWICRTQYITSIGLFYNVRGILVGGCLTCEELVVPSFAASRHKCD